jgi:hypothetical protein
LVKSTEKLKALGANTTKTIGSDLLASEEPDEEQEDEV